MDTLNGSISNKTLETALMWRNLGIATMPILARSKSPAIDKWKPYQSRLPSEFELRAWFERPGFNIAVVTGWQGLVIVDFDDPVALVDARHLPRTYQVVTARGLHLYYYVSELTQCARLNGVDIKAAGGYCLAPPSIHPNGTQYRQLDNLNAQYINRINSIADFLPEYQQAISRPPARPRASTLHPLDAAMLPHTSTTIEEANDKLDYYQLLNVGEVHTHYLCPLHKDTQPSLKVYSDGHWYCFGCGASGRDKLDLYAQLNGMTIREALCTL